MRVLLFVQTGPMRPKCVLRVPKWFGWQKVAEALGTTCFMMPTRRMADASRAARCADRSWLVECHNAEDGRGIIRCGPDWTGDMPEGRILASWSKL